MFLANTWIVTAKGHQKGSVFRWWRRAARWACSTSNAGPLFRAQRFPNFSSRCLPRISAYQAFERTEQLRLKIGELRVRFENSELGPITISAGIANAPDGCPHEQLVQEADAALLSAKRSGRNCTVMAKRDREQTSGRRTKAIA